MIKSLNDVTKKHSLRQSRLKNKWIKKCMLGNNTKQSLYWLSKRWNGIKSELKTEGWSLGYRQFGDYHVHDPPVNTKCRVSTSLAFRTNGSNICKFPVGVNISSLKRFSHMFVRQGTTWFAPVEVGLSLWHVRFANTAGPCTQANNNFYTRALSSVCVQNLAHNAIITLSESKSTYSYNIFVYSELFWLGKQRTFQPCGRLHIVGAPIVCSISISTNEML